MKFNYIIFMFALAGCSELLSPNFMGPVGPPSKIAQTPSKTMALIPFSQLNFKISSEKEHIKISIVSGQWRIEGFGVGVSDNEIVIHSVAGVIDDKGGAKDYICEKVKGNNVSVIYSDSDGSKHVLGVY